MQASRQLMENWKLQPVMSSGRLKRMRCAFQILFAPPTVMQSGSEVFVPEGCINCVEELISVSLLPKPKCAKAFTGCVQQPGRWQFEHPDRAAEYAQQLREAIECRLPSGWFSVGSKKEAQHGGCKFGSHCDTYVWVIQGGEDAFARFTMSILALATADPAPARPQLEIYFAQNKSNLYGALRGMAEIGARQTDEETRSMFSNKLQSLDDKTRKVEETDFGLHELIELRAELQAIQNSHSFRGKTDAATALEMRILSQQAVQAIDNLLNAPIVPQDDIFDRPGSMPFSRGGGIEFAPSIPSP